MKTKIIVAVLATATIIFLSCNWFRTRGKETTNPLIGEWKLDSVHTGRDTSLASFLPLAVVQNSNNINITFTKDSVFTHFKDSVDKIVYAFDAKTNQLTTKDSITQTLSFSKLNDSLISLTSKDSAVVYLLKK